jgi:ribonuclease R
MTTLRFPPQATTLAKAVTSADTLWQRPQVEGITIDGPDSRDLDDAIWIEPTPIGAIHIADVSELVEIGSILDKVAIARTTTQYFKTGNAHKAEIEQTEIFESWLRSRRKFNYPEAEAAQKDPHSPFRLADRDIPALYRNHTDRSIALSGVN